MRIGVDKNQLTGSHKKSNETNHRRMMAMGHELVPLSVPYGDYIVITPEIEETIKRRGGKLKKMDLIGVTRRSVDSKYGMEEIYGDVIGKQHERFRDELILAQQNNIQLIILIESAPEVKSLDDVKRWKNWKQLYAYCKRHKIPSGQGMMERIEDFVSHGGQKPPVSGEQLYKAMLTLSERYGTKWAFCNPADTGKAIIYLLTMKGDDAKR